MQARPLAAHDVPRAHALVAQRPLVHCFLASLLEKEQLAELVGVYVRDELHAIASVGANCVPTDLTSDSAVALANYLAAAGRRSASIVGRQSDVSLLWGALAGRWGVHRDVRPAQPFMVLEREPAVAPDPLVRRSTPADFDAVFDACVHMFTNEVGISPISRGMERGYRQRIMDTIVQGRSFARFDDGAVTFKTEVGSIASHVCQLQGVWVRPDRRGQGLAAPGLAAVAALVMREVAPALCLYVNDFNEPAKRAYEKVGFKHVDTFMTVFF